MDQPAPVMSPAAVLHGLVDALQLSGVLPEFGGIGSGGGGAAAPCGLADDALVAGVVQVEQLGRIVDSLRVRVAGEVAARSAAEYGDEGLSRSQNFSTVPKFLAALTGTRVSSAKNLVRLASRVHTTVSLVGLPNPPQFPAVAEALSAGTIGVDAASAITSRLHDVATRTGFTDDLAIAESTLVGVASQTAGGLGYTADEVDAVAIRLREHLDPDGAEPREAVLHEARTLTVHTLPTGMTRLTALLPPSMAAVVCSALEPFTSPRIVAFTDTPPSYTPPAATPPAAAPPAAASATDIISAGVTEPAAHCTTAPGPTAHSAAAPGTVGLGDAATGTATVADPADYLDVADPATSSGATLFDVAPDESGDRGDVPVDPVFADTRTVGQKRVDALVQLLSIAAGLPAMPRLNGAAPTVNVHATLTDVTSGRGVGWVDGLTTPVPASTVDTLLCHADIITTVFGEHGQVLQHGKTRRLFTTAQNRALAARDGGCVWPGCDAPPSWCESHHVEPWTTPEHQPGRTDIDNGALLCHFHHTNVHKTRWKLTIRQGTPHLTPPVSLDWTQTPRPCPPNRARQHHPPPQPWAS